MSDPIEPEILQIFYDRLFPVSSFFQWLRYDDDRNLTNREFSFTLKDDVYIRYCSFTTKEEFKEGLLRKLPYKIDIGAVFNAPPKNHNSVDNFSPESKELVFDIDITDYDSVRNCCSGADICSKCWQLMNAAVKVTDAALRQDFGFKHLLWVFSGRRGVHCWVGDRRARQLSERGRSAVVNYLSVPPGSDQDPYGMNISWPVHPSLTRASEILEPYFTECCIRQQGVFGELKSSNALFGFVPPEAQKGVTQFTDKHFLNDDQEECDGDEAVKRWGFYKDSVQRAAKRAIGTTGGIAKKTLLAPTKVMFHHCYPRLDVHVSKQLNHLLKSPFCVHPKTGKVCVPFDPNDCDNFDPFSVPTLNQLHRELSEDKDRSNRTSLDRYIGVFARFVKGLAAEHAKEEQRRVREQQQQLRSKGGRRGVEERKEASPRGMDW